MVQLVRVKRSAPAALRNREPIAKVIADELPAAGLVLEIASGTGEHAVHFAACFPSLDWQPTDPDESARESIAAWREDANCPNLRPPLPLDASAPIWPVPHADAVLCINMIHVSPPESARGLMAGAERTLTQGAPLILYGPYLEGGGATAVSNLDFDVGLRSRNPQWGIRDLAWVDALAEQNGLLRTRRVEMPANNLILVYRRR